MILAKQTTCTCFFGLEEGTGGLIGEGLELDRPAESAYQLVSAARRESEGSLTTDFAMSPRCHNVSTCHQVSDHTSEDLRRQVKQVHSGKVNRWPSSKQRGSGVRKELGRTLSNSGPRSQSLSQVKEQHHAQGMGEDYDTADLLGDSDIDEVPIISESMIYQ